jgi:hypothetical protein
VSGAPFGSELPDPFKVTAAAEATDWPGPAFAIGMSPEVSVAAPQAWISERPILSVVELTPVTVINKVVVVTGFDGVTVNPVVPALGSAPKLTLVPSEKVSVPEVIWSLRFGRSKSAT